MVSYKEFIKEASFNYNASSRPEQARFLNRGRAATTQSQTYPVQTQAGPTQPFARAPLYSPPKVQRAAPVQQPSVDGMVDQLLQHPMHKAFSQPQQPASAPAAVAPPVTQRNVATTTYPVQTTAPTQAVQTATGRNGQLTQRELKPVGKYNAGPSGKRQWYADNAFLSPRAADAFLAAQQAFGRPFPINSAYRNLEHQRGLSGEGHKVVGKAGTSRHGLGMAIDIQPNTPHYNWFKQNGPQFGWHFASIPGDPYHFEFRG